jgi:hypothetical protein
MEFLFMTCAPCSGRFGLVLKSSNRFHKLLLNAALGDIHGPLANVERFGDGLSVLAVDGGPPESVPGRARESGTDLIGCPVEDAFLVVLLPGVLVLRPLRDALDEFMDAGVATTGNLSLPAAAEFDQPAPRDFP